MWTHCFCACAMRSNRHGSALSCTDDWPLFCSCTNTLHPKQPRQHHHHLGILYPLAKLTKTCNAAAGTQDAAHQGHTPACTVVRPAKPPQVLTFSCQILKAGLMMPSPPSLLSDCSSPPGKPCQCQSLPMHKRLDGGFSGSKLTPLQSCSSGTRGCLTACRGASVE